MKTPWPARLCAALLLGSGSASSPPAPNNGWSTIRLDLEVRVLPDTRRLELEGTARLRLDDRATSSGPDLLLNVGQTKAGEPVMRYVDVTCEGADVSVRQMQNGGRAQRAEVRFDDTKRRGDEVQVDFVATSDGFGSQLLVTETVAIASWTTGWHPFTSSSSSSGVVFHAGVPGAPGRTRLQLPAGWIGIVDGELVERTKTDDATIEVWETPGRIARSFVAGPYSAVSEEVDGRVVHVYLLSDDKPMGSAGLARLVAEAMSAQEARLGPFPFDSYGVVETPRLPPGQRWSAASQQTFIIAKSDNFDHEHGNLPLWAHEMAHGWWGNTVGTRGPGSKWVGETLAQVGALLAIETLEGPDALREFLGFSRTGYSPLQCAAGYFTLVRQGQDQALGRMGLGPGSHELADSKGAWVYHMLRQVVGDDVFFGVLREVIADLSHDQLSVAEMRRRFVVAAPEHDLRAFFAQWLDRTGAPILDADWFATPEGDGLVLELVQAQDGEPFAFDLDVEVSLAGGERVVRTVPVRDASHTFVLDSPARPCGVRLDPGYKVLLWRPEYGPRPTDEVPGATATPPEVLAAVVGTYRARGSMEEIEIFERDGQLFARPDGQLTIPLVHDAGGVFHIAGGGRTMTIEFDLSATPAPSVKSIEDGREFVADRVER